MSFAERFRYNALWYYFALMFTVHPLFFVNMYFNISQEKWLFFILSSIAGVFIVTVSFLYDNDALTHLKSLTKNLTITDIAMLAFLIAAIISTILSDYPRAALLGERARYHGLSNFIAYFIIFLLARKYFYKAAALIELLVGIGAFVSVTAVCQYLTWDPIGMYKGVTVQSVHRMISTIGNMNIYASFLSMILPLTMYFYISQEKVKSRIIYGIFLMIGFAGAIAGNSDSVYIGIGAGLAIMIASGGLSSANLKRLPETFAWGGLGAYLILTAAHILRDKGAVIRPTQGFSKYFTEHTEYVLIFFIVFAVISLILSLASKAKASDRVLFGKKTRWILTALLLLAIITIFTCAFVFFPFADEFGSYRGFIWRLAVNDFKHLSFFQKLVGYGPETIMPIYNSKYYDEMIAITGVVYDNVHCEPLEYLVTSGFLGFATYMLLVISLIVRLYRKASSDSNCYLYLVPVFAYFAQSFVNIAQSATTPIFFLIMALGNGYLNPDRVDTLRAEDEFTAEELLGETEDKY